MKTAARGPERRQAVRIADRRRQRPGGCDHGLFDEVQDGAEDQREDIEEADPLLLHPGDGIVDGKGRGIVETRGSGKACEPFRQGRREQPPGGGQGEHEGHEPTEMGRQLSGISLAHADLVPPVPKACPECAACR